jgi:hypothetical protein
VTIHYICRGQGSNPVIHLSTLRFKFWATTLFDKKIVGKKSKSIIYYYYTSKKNYTRHNNLEKNYTKSMRMLVIEEKSKIW